MTYPVPERLVPIRREARLSQGVAMLAVIAIILAVLAGLDVTIAALSPFDLACFALAALSLHLVWPVAFPTRRA